MNKSETVYDGRIYHPFTCLVAGPSGSGKSTFVRDLMLNQSKLSNTIFDFVTIVIGTDASVNPTLTGLASSLKGKVKIIELHQKYPSSKLLRENFPTDLKAHLEHKSQGGKRNGCVIFDDVMSDLAECDLLVDLFTKYSSHYSISVIYITQNLFFKAGGKHGTDNVTLYRNTHLLVVFRTPMDHTVLRTLAHRLYPQGPQALESMMAYVLEHYRYIAIYGRFDRAAELRYVTDMFATDPVPHQKVFLPV